MLCQQQQHNPYYPPPPGSGSFPSLPSPGTTEFASGKAWPADVGGLSSLNTLVLKNNRIATLGDSLAKCAGLAKLSMAHNQLSDLATSLAGCPQLAELRLGHNQLSGLPTSLAGCPRLKIVDLGGNLVESLAAVKVRLENSCRAFGERNVRCY